MKKLILKVFLHDEKTKQKAIKSMSGLQGVEWISIDMKDQKMTVGGDIDPVEVVRKLRKICSTEVLSVGPAKEEKKKEEPKKEEPEKEKEEEEPKKEEPRKDKEEEEPEKEEPKKDKEEEEPEKEEPKKEKEEEEPKKEEPKKEKEQEEPKKEEPKKGKRKDEYTEFSKAYDGYYHAGQYPNFVKSRSVEDDQNACAIC